MSLDFEISDKLGKILEKLGRKDRNLSIAVNKKIKQIVNSDITEIEHFKNLRGDMSHLKRVHVRKFVLSFGLRGEKIIFENLKHHDDAYKR